MSDAYTCGCRGTVHDPTCWVWHHTRSIPPPDHPTFVVNVSEPMQDDLRYGELQCKLDRIIALLEEIAGRRR